MIIVEIVTRNCWIDEFWKLVSEKIVRRLVEIENRFTLLNSDQIVRQFVKITSHDS